MLHNILLRSKVNWHLNLLTSMLCGRELPHFEKAEINILAEYYRPGQTFQG